MNNVQKENGVARFRADRPSNPEFFFSCNTFVGNFFSLGLYLIHSVCSDQPNRRNPCTAGIYAVLSVYFQVLYRDDHITRVMQGTCTYRRGL